MMDKDINLGMRINGWTPSIMGCVKPILGWVSSSRCHNFTGIERQITPSGGLMGGEVLSPPSKTTILESISSRDNLNWWVGTLTSRSISCILRCFFLARRDLRWRTLGDLTIKYAPDAHWVCSELVELDSKKTWTHEGWGPFWWIEGDGVNKSTSKSSLQVSVVWQLKVYETVLEWVKVLQW